MIDAFHFEATHPDIDGSRTGSLAQGRTPNLTMLTSKRGILMSRDNDKNDELREEHEEQAEHRQHLRDEVLGESEGGVDDFGSQDERRKDGFGRF